LPITSTVCKIMPDIGLGDVIVYHHPATDYKQYYGMVVELGDPHFNTVTNPAQWILVRWMGKRPFQQETDLVNKTTSLVKKYVIKE